MENYKNLSVSLLNEMLKTCNNSRMYAEYKLQYLSPCNPNAISQISEFSKMRDQAAFNITRISNCITWISSLETELTT